MRGVFNKHCLLTFFIISRTNSKTSQVNQQSVLSLWMFHHYFLKIWTGQSLLPVSLSKIHRQNLNNILFFFKETNNIYSWRIKKSLEIFFFYFPRKLVGWFVNQLIKISSLTYELCHKNLPLRFSTE